MNAFPRSLLSRIVPVRPGESRLGGYFFAHFFFLMAAMYVSKVSKTALFLGRGFTPISLPFVYFLSAVLTGVFAAWNTRRIRALGRRSYIAWSQVLFAAGTAGFWVLFGTEWAGVRVLYWFWFEIFILASVTQFWVAVADACEPRQAKRLVSFFVSGGLLGGIFGSLLTTVLAPGWPTRNLILLGLVFYVAGAAFMRAAMSAGLPLSLERKAGGPAPDYLDGLKTVARNPYLRLLSAMIVAALAAATMIDAQFNLMIKSAFSDSAERTAFLGSFHVVVLVVSWILNALLADRIIRGVGVRAALFVTPLVLLLGSGAVFLVPAAGLATWAVFLKGADKSLTHTFSQAIREILYIPVSQDIKARAKMTIDMFISKGGEALASVLQVIFGVLLAFGPRGMSLVTIGIIAGWALILVRIGRRYVPAIRANLIPSRPDADRVLRENTRSDTAKRLFDLLESRERSSVLYAYNLLDLLRAEKLTPELRQVLDDKSAEVRACSIDTLLDADCQALGPDWVDRAEGETLAAAVTEILALDVYQEVMKRPFEEIAAADESSCEVDQMEVAKALGMMPPDSPLVDNLARLLKHESPEVVHYALESAARHGKRDLLPHIIPHLGRPAVRDRAAETLEAYGDTAVPAIKDWLAASGSDPAVRGALPGVLAGIGSQKAADVLVRQLRRRDPDVAGEIVEALFRIRTRRGEVRFHERDVRAEIRERIREACAAILDENGEEGAPYRPGPEGSERAGSPVPGYRPILLLLGLLHPPEEIGQVIQNYAEGTRRAVDYALELLENVLSGDWKDVVLPLLEDAPREEKVRSCRRILKSLG